MTPPSHPSRPPSNLRFETDQSLVASCLDGSHISFETLIDRHVRGAFAVAFSITGSSVDSEDVLQEAFLIAYQGLEGLNRPEDFGPWLHGIVRKRALRHRRSCRLRERTLSQLAWTTRSTTSPVPRGEPFRLPRDLLDEGLKSLPESLRVTLVLFYFEKMSTTAVSAALGIRPATVRKRLQLARDRLRKDLTPRLLSALSVVAIPPSLPQRVSRSLRHAKHPRQRSMNHRRQFVRLTGVFLVLGLLSFIATRLGPQDRVDSGAMETSTLPPMTIEPQSASRPLKLPSRISTRILADESRPGRIAFKSGQVVDRDSGAPIRNVAILDLETQLRTRSNQSGRFSLDGSNRLRLTASGYLARDVHWTEGTSRIELISGTTIRGRVQCENGLPVRDGHVIAHQSLRLSDRVLFPKCSSERSLPIPIQEDGSFEITVIDDHTILEIDVPGFLPHLSSPFIPRDRRTMPWPIELERGYAQRLRIVDLDGKGLGDAGLTIQLEKDSSPPSNFLHYLTHERQARTNAQGWVSLSGLTKTVTLTVTKPGFNGLVKTISVGEAPKTLPLTPGPSRCHASSNRPSTVSAPDSTQPRDVARSILASRVVDESGQPVSGVRVQLLDHRSLTELESTVTGLQGRFKIALPSAERSYRLRYSKGQFAPSTAVLKGSNGTQAPSTLTLFKGLRLDGFLFDEDGRSFSDAWLVAYGPTGQETGIPIRAEDDGSFVFHGLTDGVHTIRCYPKQRAYATACVTLPSESALSIQLERGRSHRGVIQRFDGSPSPRTAVALHFDPFLRVAWTNEHGVYSFEGVPHGSLTLLALNDVDASFEIDVEKDQDLPSCAILKRGATLTIFLPDSSPRVLRCTQTSHHLEIATTEDHPESIYRSIARSEVCFQESRGGRVEFTGLHAGAFAYRVRIGDVDHEGAITLVEGERSRVDLRADVAPTNGR